VIPYSFFQLFYISIIGSLVSNDNCGTGSACLLCSNQVKIIFIYMYLIYIFYHKTYILLLIIDVCADWELLLAQRSVSLFVHGPFSNKYTNIAVICAACIGVICVYVPGIKIITMTEDPLSEWIFYGALINLVLQLGWTEWRKWFSRNYPESSLSKFLAW